MNTDNMSILGLTIDYGPFQFMEYFNPRQVSNHSDTEGRYCYENQPSVCKWNMLRLAEALEPILPLEWTNSVI
jgi:serine/tyrosine/threonine adenylyltransferase